jgi:hypothetical protein
MTTARSLLSSGSDPPYYLDQPADGDRDAERQQQSGPGLVLEGPAAQAADEE